MTETFLCWQQVGRLLFPKRLDWWISKISIGTSKSCNFSWTFDLKYPVCLHSQQCREESVCGTNIMSSLIGKIFNLEGSLMLIKGQLISNEILLSSIFPKNELEKCYLPNLLVITLWDQIFVFWVRDLKFRLLAYFLILLCCAKFQQDWATLILDIL